MSETLEPALPAELDEQAERLMRGLCDRGLSVAGPVRVAALKALLEMLEDAVEA